MNKIDYAIKAEGLMKRFKNFTAVDGIDLKIEKGKVYGFLGPNSAGKTTVVRMLATLLKPDKGQATVFRHDIDIQDVKAIRHRISLTGQYTSIDEGLTGWENLMMISRLMGYSRKAAKQRTEELLHAFGLIEAAKRPIKNYSGGMRRRIDIAASIVVVPDLLFLDESTTGLDPRSRNQVWGIIRSLTKKGTTILLTTQYLDEADQLADRIAVMNNGQVIAEGTPDELKTSIGANIVHIILKNEHDRENAQTILSNQLGIIQEYKTKPNQIKAFITDAWLSEWTGYLLGNHGIRYYY